MDGIIWFSVYCSLSVLNGFIQIWFLPSIEEWYKEVRQAEAAEEDTLEELGFFDGDEEEDAGPIIFAGDNWQWEF